jgi:hypothetical protein
VEKEMRKPTSPFKFNSEWIKEESYTELVKTHWVPFDASSGEPTTIQFVENLKKVKKATVEWDSQKEKMMNMLCWILRHP